ncbi:hypothetical protein CUR178_05539 [Leishmania enriettii]|uniref:Uncharacterized protein n=1 Tax=Leishmania enriettii TaxID=5663 RepID=A0A836KUT5_LEIEN|nr:hypothetical protein CUR178_05539 [Leishmania enriettii]
MRPLRVKKRESTGVPSGDETPIDSTPSVSPVIGDGPAACLVPSPPPVKGWCPLLHPGHDSSPSTAAACPAPMTAFAAVEPGGDVVKFSSVLDNAAVEAYLEYLTRPHTSWGSASRFAAHRREVIEEHRHSVYARSLALLRRSSFASTARSEGGDQDALEASTTSSVASAPAGFPRTARNGSKTSTGTLRKGRLGDGGVPPLPSDTAAPFSILTHSSSGVSSTHSAIGASRSFTNIGRRGPSNKGRLSRGPTLAGSQRLCRTSSSTPTPAALSGGGLTVGGTQLLGGRANLFVVQNGHDSAVTSRTAPPRDAEFPHPVVPQVGSRSAADCKRASGVRAGALCPQSKHPLK